MKKIEEKKARDEAEAVAKEEQKRLRALAKEVAREMQPVTRGRKTKITTTVEITEEPNDNESE